MEIFDQLKVEGISITMKAKSLVAIAYGVLTTIIVTATAQLYTILTNDISTIRELTEFHPLVNQHALNAYSIFGWAFALGAASATLIIFLTKNRKSVKTNEELEKANISYKQALEDFKVTKSKVTYKFEDPDNINMTIIQEHTALRDGAQLIRFKQKWTGSKDADNINVWDLINDEKPNISDHQEGDYIERIISLRHKLKEGDSAKIRIKSTLKGAKDMTPFFGITPEREDLEEIEIIAEFHCDRLPRDNKVLCRIVDKNTNMKTKGPTPASKTDNVFKNKFENVPVNHRAELYWNWD